jgi:hypothetical protein
MIEPLPLARGDGSPELLASRVSRNLASAFRVVMAMSKQPSLTEYLPFRHHWT